MSDYTITHACGHVHTYDLRGPVEKRVAESEFLAVVPCSDCRRSAPLQFAPMDGTPQAVKIAEAIRQQHLPAVRAELESAIEAARTDSRAAKVARQRHLTPNIRKWAIVWASLTAVPLAQWWVNNRTATLPQLIRAAIRDGFMPNDFIDD